VRRAFCLVAVALSVLAAAPERSAADDLPVVVRVSGEADRSLLERARGQASDLRVTILPREGALEATLAAQVAAAPGIAVAQAARGVIWFASAPGGGVVVHTWRAQSAEVVVRAVDGPGGAAGEAVASATLEVAAVVVRTSLRALIDGEAARELAHVPAPPRPTALALAPAPASESLRPMAMLGPLWAHDGVSAAGAPGLVFGAGVGSARFALDVSAGATLPTSLSDQLTELQLWRAFVALGAFARLRLATSFTVSAGLRAGAALFLRSTEAQTGGVSPRAPGRSFSALLAPEIGLRLALGPRLGLVLSLAADVVPGAPSLVYARGERTEGPRPLWRVQPRLGLGLVLGGG
jgi:hypothetical protein